MEVILVAIVIGVLGLWAFTANKKRKQNEASAEVHYKVETPAGG